jgi:4-hydroxyphenylpyruvate dioxygenase
MKIDRVHFYLEDATAWRNWFTHKLGFQAVASSSNASHTRTEVVRSGSVYFVLSSPLTPLSPVAQFLRQHPPGVADVAFCVENLAAVIQRAIAYGAKVLQPIQHQEGCKWAKIAAWGSLAHTLIESREARGEDGENSHLPPSAELRSKPTAYQFTGIDHIVLNVAAGDLERAVAWYENVLEFHSQQRFKIQTDRSALHSQVMVSRDRCVQFPINQPASPNSQIQEFLDVNRGSGIQHIALQTPNIVQAIAQFRSCGVSFLPVPPTYYTQLQERQGLPLSAAEFAEIARQQILIDWQETNPHALLLQTFTQPIFAQPTFFFELIERRSQAEGFGEGNFRALFEAIEREQIKRGSLATSD